MTRQFQQRMLISLLGIVVLVICIYYSNLTFFKPFFALLNGVIISLALREYYQLSELKGFQPLTYVGMLFTLIYALVLPYSFDHSLIAILPSLILLGALLIFFLIFFNRQSSSLGNLAVTIFGFAYLVLPLSCALRINYFFPHQDGRLWLAYILIVCKITDVGAYFCGKCFGKTKLAPSISPKKTIEGALGGTIAALIASFVFAIISSYNDMASIFKLTFWQSIWIGLLISILAQLGDLAESVLKRDAGVKDSSHLPGLGGFLDVVDSLVFTLPLMYLLLSVYQ